METGHNIDSLRVRIDAIDREVVALLQERAGIAISIGEIKRETGKAEYDPGREQRVLDRVATAAEGPLTPGALQAVYREVISACRALERRYTVAYYGPAGSHSHDAAIRRFGHQTNFVPYLTFEEVFDEVEHGRVHYGMVPIENSTDGMITPVMDAFQRHLDVQIIAEISVRIHHHLLSHAPNLQTVKQVYTMFQTEAQCREWLLKHLPGVPHIPTKSTSEAAERAAADPTSAGIANHLAAERFQLPQLAKNIEDNPHNITRFWVIGRAASKPGQNNKTSLLLDVPNVPGSLCRALNVLASHEVSVAIIEPRPTRVRDWEYVWFVDAVGHMADPDGRLQKAVEALHKEHHVVRVLGSYPASELPDY